MGGGRDGGEGWEEEGGWEEKIFLMEESRQEERNSQRGRGGAKHRRVWLRVGGCG